MAEKLSGIVIKSTGSWYAVRTQDGQVFKCRIRGKFRAEGIKSTNPVAVGDHVDFSIVQDDEGVISGIHPRKNYIARKSVNLSRQTHIIAANVDQAFLVVSLIDPVTYPAFIDRFTATAEAFHIPVTIVYNKFDLYGEDERNYLAELMEAYEIAGYEQIITSVEWSLHLDDLKELLKDKVTLFSGNSGVGKSSLANAIAPGLTLKTAKISSQHGTGQHTTTYAEMHDLPFGGYLIDTPGIKGFGMVHIEREELRNYFPEMHKLLPQCHFYNCLHLNEPKCAVKKAVKNGEIGVSRYESYLSMMDEEDTYR